MGIIPWIGFKTVKYFLTGKQTRWIIRLDSENGQLFYRRNIKFLELSYENIFLSKYFDELSFYNFIYLCIIFLFLKSAVPGWTSIVLIISFFNIIIFFILGLISEYVGRIFKLLIIDLIIL